VELEFTPTRSSRALLAARRVIAASLAARHVRAWTAMAPAPAVQRKAIALALVSILAVALVAGLRLTGLLTASDERRQPVDVAAVGDRRARLG